MTSKAIKKKVIDYINKADQAVVETVYSILRLYEDAESKSLMTSEQKLEIEKRSTLYKQGKTTAASWDEVKKRARKK